MNILFTYPTVFHPLSGGVEKVTDMLAKEFSRRGHNIFYAHHIKPIEDFNLPFKTFFFPSEDYNSPDNYKFYTKLLKEQNIDIVINQCGAHGDSILYNYVTGTKAKTVSVIHFSPGMYLAHYWDDISTLRNNRLKEKIKRIGRCVFYSKLKRDYSERLSNHYRWLFDHTNVICLLSSRFTNELECLTGDEYDSRKVIAINNPIENFPEVPNKKENIILWVGRFDIKHKRPDLCLKIWEKISKQLPDWRLIMIGAGKDYDYILDKAKKIERVTFTGHTDPEPYYNRAKILMMTSLSEGWGMVLTEAIAHNVVPIAFDSFVAVRDIISEEELLVTPFDVDEYAQKLKSLIETKGFIADVLSGLRETINQYSLSATADKWENVFNNLIIGNSTQNK